MAHKHRSIALAGLAVVAVVCCTASDACTIVDKRSARLGTDRGIQGRCANNGESITCTLDDDGEGLDCSGPSGEFSGDNLNLLVRAACGCADPQQDTQSLERQLETYP